MKQNYKTILPKQYPLVRSKTNNDKKNIQLLSQMINDDADFFQYSTNNTNSINQQETNLTKLIPLEKILGCKSVVYDNDDSIFESLSNKSHTVENMLSRNCSTIQLSHINENVQHYNDGKQYYTKNKKSIFYNDDVQYVDISYSEDTSRRNSINRTILTKTQVFDNNRSLIMNQYNGNSAANLLLDVGTDSAVFYEESAQETMIQSQYRLKLKYLADDCEEIQKDIQHMDDILEGAEDLIAELQHMQLITLKQLKNQKQCQNKQK